MKKLYYIIGAIVTATAIIGVALYFLKKVRDSLVVEGLEDELVEDELLDDDITVSIEDDEASEIA